MADYELKIDFQPDSRNPSRVFRSMAGLIESFGRFDRDFLATIDLPVTSEFLLHDVERGSLKAVLRWLLELPDKEALRDGDWKKVLGRVLDDARTFLLQKLEDEPKITERSQLEAIQGGLSEIATTAPANLIHVPRILTLPRLLTTIELFESSTRVLLDGDSVQYISEHSVQRISKEIVIDRGLQEELLETIPIQHPTRMRLPVKKPDLIGDSQWDLYMGGRVIRAKILDAQWLDKFHHRTLELKPGDALDALLDITLLQSPEGEVVGYRYQVMKVYGTVRQPKGTQLEWPDGPDEDA